MEWKIVGNKNNFEDTYSLEQLNKIFKKKRGYEFSLPKPGDSVILLLSGGIDSISLWNVLFKKYCLNVYPIHFKAERLYQLGEERSINLFSKIYKKRFPKYFHDISTYPIKFLFNFRKYESSKFPYESVPIFSNLIFNKKTHQYAALLINNPTRLAHYAFNAYEYALKLKIEKNINIKHIIIGIVTDDGKSSREATLTVLRSINLSFCLILGDFSWQFTGPLEKKTPFNFTKKSLGKIALESGLPLEKTWSCTMDSTVHCGQCPSCHTRKDFYASLHIVDPTRYKISLFPKLIGLANIIKNKYSGEKDTLKAPKLRLNLIIKISPDIIWQEIDKTTYRLNKQNGVIDSLKKGEALIWQCLAKSGHISLNSLIEIISHNKKNKQVESINNLLIFIRHSVETGYLIVSDK